MPVSRYFALILLLSFTRATAQQNDSLPVISHLHSTIVGDDYTLFVSLPAGYDPSHSGYPVLYVTDANSNFTATVQITRRLTRQKEIPPVIVVGIGYRSDSLAKTLRLRDMTPDHDPSIRRSHAGRSSYFLRFIKEELMPYVQKNYRASHDAYYTGMAIGGVFGLYVLLHEPETFKGYLVASPSIWYDSSVIFKYEREYAGTHHDLKARLYIGVGGQEEKEANFTNMETNAKRLTTLLADRHYPNLHLDSKVLDGETHTSVYPAALRHGLPQLFR
jgi:predicted alpha/beta superfamily hydrolase